MGAPVACTDQPIDAAWPACAKTSLTACWSAASTLMPKQPSVRIRGQLVLVLAGQTATSGGASDNETKDCAAKPMRSPLSLPVTMATPVQNWPIVSR